MIYKGDLVDQFGGVPQDQDKIADFFEKAAAFGNGSDEGQPAQQEKSASKSGLIVEKQGEGNGQQVSPKDKIRVKYAGKLQDGT